jgi:hypothetical protein
VKRPLLFALAAMAATCVSTMLAYAPISRFLSKIGGEPSAFARHLFVTQVLPSMAAGLAMVVVALCLAGRKPVLAMLFLAAAPIAVVGADLALIVLA